MPILRWIRIDYDFVTAPTLVHEICVALDCLERANLAGMSIAEWAENDSDLDSLHGNPRFQVLMESLKDQ